MPKLRNTWSFSSTPTRLHGVVLNQAQRLYLYFKKYIRRMLLSEPALLGGHSFLSGMDVDGISFNTGTMYIYTCVSIVIPHSPDRDMFACIYYT